MAEEDANRDVLPSRGGVGTDNAATAAGASAELGVSHIEQGVGAGPTRVSSSSSPYEDNVIGAGNLEGKGSSLSGVEVAAVVEGDVVAVLRVAVEAEGRGGVWAGAANTASRASDARDGRRLRLEVGRVELRVRPVRVDTERRDVVCKLCALVGARQIGGRAGAVNVRRSGSDSNSGALCVGSVRCQVSCSGSTYRRRHWGVVRSGERCSRGGSRDEGSHRGCWVDTGHNSACAGWCWNMKTAASKRNSSRSKVLQAVRRRNAGLCRSSKARSGRLACGLHASLLSCCARYASCHRHGICGGRVRDGGSSDGVQGHRGDSRSLGSDGVGTSGTRDGAAQVASACRRCVDG